MGKIFYHSADLDGKCSAAIALNRFPDYELRPIDYGDPFPWSDIAHRETVIMVDFSLQPDTALLMLRLSHLAALTWIDHHKSALIQYNPKPEVVNGIRDTSKAACELAWEYFFPERPMPRAVHLLGRYDVWDHAAHADVLPFQWGMRLENTEPRQDIWKYLFFDPPRLLARIIADGRIALKFQSLEDEKYVHACGFETILANHRCLAINRVLANSRTFTSQWDPNRYEAMLAFGRKNGKWVVHLYSDRDDIDVSELARKYGGGGHKGAAGFICDDTLPFKY